VQKLAAGGATFEFGQLVDVVEDGGGVFGVRSGSGETLSRCVRFT